MIIMTKKRMEYPDIVNGVPKKRVLEIGKHVVDSMSMDHWFVKGNIKSGDIIVIGEKEPPPSKMTVSVPENASGIVQRILVHGVKPVHTTVPEQSAVKVEEILPKPKEKKEAKVKVEEIPKSSKKRKAIE